MSDSLYVDNAPPNETCVFKEARLVANADSSTRRQSTTDKAASAAKPDSQKSVLEQGQDQVKGAADTVGGTIQPESDKSATQGITDTVTGSGGSAEGQGQSVLGQVQDAAGSAAKSVQDTLGMGEKK